jgi:hypothetical protein
MPSEGVVEGETVGAEVALGEPDVEAEAEGDCVGRAAKVRTAEGVALGRDVCVAMRVTVAGKL